MLERNKPLNTAFVITSMHVGGAETLLANLITRVDRSRIQPVLVCLKEPGVLGEELSQSIPVYSNLLRNKFDVRVFQRLGQIYRQKSIDAVITVGAGDKMFWGRLAAKWNEVPIIASALHSTGWPDEIRFCNRLLTPITDAFIAVADSHRDYLKNVEHLPENKIFVVPNGIDTDRFSPRSPVRAQTRRELGIEESDPVVGIVAALRPEKDHLLFLDVARELLKSHPNSKFLIIGDGPQRPVIEQAIANNNLSGSVRMLGSRADTERFLNAMDVFVLTSKNEAKPVSILEALATQVPPVAPDVGSVRESVIEGETGYLISTRQPTDFSAAISRILEDSQLRAKLGEKGRELVCQYSSLDSMVYGYESLLWQLNCQRKGLRWPKWIAQRLTQAIPIPNVSHTKRAKA